MESKIKIEYKGKTQIGGTVSDLMFTVKWGKGKVTKVENDIIVSPLKKQVGILYLSMHKTENKIGGMPMLPSKSSTLRYYAKFEEGKWHILNGSYRTEINDLIEYIYKIKSFSIV